MATRNLGDLLVTPNWANIVSTYPSAASVDIFVQNICAGNEVVQVAGGTASATAPDGSGTFLRPFESTTINSATVWVKCEQGGQSNDKVSVSLL